MNDLLAEVVRFFEAKGFVVSTEKRKSQTVVSVKSGGQAGDKILDVHLETDVAGSLMVIFDSFEGSPFVRNSPLMSALGGGFLTLSRLKILRDS